MAEHYTKQGVCWQAAVWLSGLHTHEAGPVYSFSNLPMKPSQDGSIPAFILQMEAEL